MFNWEKFKQGRCEVFITNEEEMIAFYHAGKDMANVYFQVELDAYIDHFSHDRRYYIYGSHYNNGVYIHSVPNENKTLYVIGDVLGFNIALPSPSDLLKFLERG